jgi:(R,R)-butanediol dehydrogenase / meso-butanediol dehydrogenase / diacetyl reductase
MLQVAVHGVDETRVDDAPPPDPGPRDVVVKISACGICGSDLTYIKMGGFCVTGGPMPLGHEMAGIVDWVGPEVTDVAVGNRVTVFPGDPYADGFNIIGNGGAEGGLTDFLVVRDAARGRRVFRVPDDMSLDVAALAEPVAVGMKAARRTDAVAGDNVAVFGCGPIGLAAIAQFVDSGVNVVGIDLSPRRLELAGGLGAQAVLNPSEVDVWEELMRLHGTHEHMNNPMAGTTAFVEASGSNPVLAQMIERARPLSHISIVALHMQPVEASFLNVMSKQLEIKGSMGYPPRFEDAVELLTRQDLSSVITHRVPLSDFGDALDILGNDKDCGKVLVTTGSGD